VLLINNDVALVISELFTEKCPDPGFPLVELL
jgi:hypothetical protein